MSRLEQQHGDDWQRREAQRRAAREGAKAGATSSTEGPTFSECVIGYRAWGVDPWLRLWPITGFGEQPWSPGINRAVCGRGPADVLDPFMKRAPEGHAVPHQDCGCGFYSRRRANDVLDQIVWPPFEQARNPVFVGAIAVWGDLCVHHDGFRASHACIVALATAPDMPPEALDLAERVAQRYGVPLVAPDELEAEASRSGTPLPDDVRPPEPQGLASGGFVPGTWTLYTSAPPTPPPPDPPRRPSALRVLAHFAVMAAATALWGSIVRSLLALHGALMVIALVVGYVATVVGVAFWGPAGSRRRREGTAAS